MTSRADRLGGWAVTKGSPRGVQPTVPPSRRVADRRFGAADCSPHPSGGIEHRRAPSAALRDKRKSIGAAVHQGEQRPSVCASGTAARAATCTTSSSYLLRKNS